MTTAQSVASSEDQTALSLERRLPDDNLGTELEAEF